MASASGPTPPSINPDDLKALYALYQNTGATSKEGGTAIVNETKVASESSFKTLSNDQKYPKYITVSENHACRDLSNLSKSDKALEKFYNVLTKISNLWSSFVSKFSSSHDKNYIIDLQQTAEEAEMLGEAIYHMPSTAQEVAPAARRESAPTESKASRAPERPASGRRDSVELKQDLQEFLYDSGDRYTLLLADQAKEKALPAFKEKFSQAKKELESSIKEADDFITGKSSSTANPEAIKASIKSKIDNIKTLIKASEQARVDSHGDRIKEMKDFQSTLLLSQTRISNKLNEFYMRTGVGGQNEAKIHDQLRVVDAANERCKNAI